ncbi:TPA: gp53-like domain-containing protein [Citrobacter amalonaticus]
MHRIDTATAQKDKFGAGKNGFTRGNPQTGTPATDLDDDYFDMLQEELCAVVEESGAELDKGKHDQLLTALRSLLLSRSNPFGDIASDGPEAIATALANLHLGGTANYADLGNGYRLVWVKGNAPGGALAATAAVAVSLTFPQAFGSTPIIYWSAVSTPSGVTAGAGIVATCADLTATGMSINLYNASNANKQITSVIGFAIGKM